MNRRAFWGFALGPAGVGLLSAVSLPVMTWIFPVDIIGMISMLQVAIGLSIVLCCLGLDQAYGREYHESVNRAELLLNTVLPGLLLLVVFLAVISLFDPQLLSLLLYGTSSIALGAITAICLVTAFLSRFLSVLLRMQERGFAYSFSQMMNRLVLLLIVIGYAAFTSTRTFMMLLVAQAVALLLTLLVFAWSTRKEWWLALHARLRFVQLRRLLAFGFPLTFAGVASWGVATLDRVFLRSLSSYEELAVFSVAASIAAGVNILAGILNTIWAPMVYKWVAENADMERVDTIAQQTSVIVFLVVCLVGGFSWVLGYMLPASYAKVPFLIVGCMIAPLFYTLSEVTGIGIAVSRRTFFSLAASLVAVLLDIGLCLVLVPRFGAVGATVATAFSFWLFFLLRTEFGVMTWRKLRRGKVHLYSVLCLLLALVYAAWGQRIPGLAITGWWLVFCAILCIERQILIGIWRDCQKFIQARRSSECESR